MAEKTKHPAKESRKNAGSDGSEHSHFEYGSTHGQWDRDDGSDFAITSVNVPDRLDTQEVRARAADDTRTSVQRFHRDDLMRAGKWLLAALVLAAAFLWAVRAVVPIRAAISPAGIEDQVSKALGVPVSVASTELRFSPTPRLVISGMIAQSGWQLPEIAVHFNWRDVVRALRTSTWALGEARVGPVELSGQDALALLHAVRGATALPAPVSTIHFQSVSFPDLVLLPGRYEAVLRRGGKQGFASIALARLDVQGRVDLEITSPSTPEGNAGFAFFATGWPASVGPAVNWKEATAQGEFRGDLLKVDTYSVGAPFGNLNGAAVISKVGSDWRVSGTIRSPDLSLEELTRHAAGLGDGEAALARIPLRGTAKIDLTVAGAGSTVDEALRTSRATGAASVSGATVSGLNLGMVATQGDPALAGGVTRLTDLDFDLIASANGVAIRNIAGRAGSLRVHGDFDIDRKLQLNGAIRPEVMSPRGVTSAQVRLGGTVASPTYR
jgi:hypothetical protein